MTQDEFTKLSKQIAALSDQFSDQFAKLYQHFDERTTAIEDKLDDKASRNQVDDVMQTLDSITKEQEIGEHERLAANHQLDRHEGWIEQLAQKTGTKLSYE